MVPKMTLWARTLCLVLPREPPPHPAAIDRSRHIIIGLTSDNGVVAVSGAEVQGRVDLGIRAARLSAAINVVAHDARRDFTPRQIYTVLRWRRSVTCQGLACCRISSIADK